MIIIKNIRTFILICALIALVSIPAAAADDSVLVRLIAPDSPAMSDIEEGDPPLPAAPRDEETLGQDGTQEDLEHQSPPSEEETVEEQVYEEPNDEQAILQGTLYDSQTYVPLRDFFEKMGSCSITWDQTTKTALIKTDRLTIEVFESRPYFIANERCFYIGNPLMKEGSLYVPLRPFATLFGGDISWDGDNREVELVCDDYTLVAGDEFYIEDEVLWLSRIIMAESGNQPLLGKVAVGNVIMNRVKSPSFPSSIYDVIFDRTYSVQFTPTVSGRIYNEPNFECVVAAKLCLEGFEAAPEIIYFTGLNPKNSWIDKNRPHIITIGNHRFYS